MSEVTPQIIKGERDRSTLLSNHLLAVDADVLEHPPMADETESLLRDGEKAPHTETRIKLAADYKLKIKSIDETAWKMR